MKAAARVPGPLADPIATTAGSSLSAMACSTRSGAAPPRSILLTKTTVGIRSRRKVRISTRVWACTPSTAETTSTAPSSTFSTRSTSAMKSGWPGVSIRLTVTSSMRNDTTADLMVMPRCRSRARVSVWVLPWSTLPISPMTPASYSSRSVRVVLPASTWARIPRLSVGTGRHVLWVGDSFRVDVDACGISLSLVARPSPECSRWPPAGQPICPAAGW
jgi:hypothetical protein